MRKFLAGMLIVLFATSVWAWPLSFVIDRFDSGLINPLISSVNSPPEDPVVLWSPTPPSNPMVASLAWGGQRFWEAGMTSGLASDSTSLRILTNARQLAWSNSSGLMAHLDLGYGSYASVAVDSDWTGVTGLLVVGIATDPGSGRLIAEIDTTAGTRAVPVGSGAIITGPGQYVLPFTAFTQQIAGVGFDLLHVEGVRFSFTSLSDGWDITLGNGGLALTPEPTTLTLLGLGALALVRRRRKS